MRFGDAVKSVFSNYSNFQGRAPRSEYWYYVLFCVMLGIAAGVIDVFFFGIRDPRQHGPTEIILNLALFLPSLAVTARRLHDVDKSGWWMLIALTVIGIIPLVYWYAKEGDKAINRFGAAGVS